MTEIVLALVIAVLAEAVVEYGKSVIAAFKESDIKTAVTQLCALTVGVLLCLSTGADVLTPLGVTFAYPWIGCVLTGIFASRGANYVSDLLRRLSAVSGTGTTDKTP